MAIPLQERVPEHALSRAVAAEIRAQLARQGKTQRQLASQMHREALWVSRRLSPTMAKSVSISLEELEEFARALNVPWWQLLPRLDSNQQPFGNQPQVRVDRVRATSRAGARRGHLRAIRAA